MKKDIYDLIVSSMNDNEFRKIIISGAMGSECPYKKITVVPKSDSCGIFYQFEMFTETQVKHENFRNTSPAIDNIIKYLEIGYKQTDILTAASMLRIYKNKTGYSTIRRAVSVPVTETDGHNREKNYPIPDNAPFLHGLGITGNNGKVLADKQKKFRQINRYVEMIGDIIDALPEEPRILDIGCGYAYLSFALYHYLTNKGFRPVMLGVDIKADVIANCKRIADETGFKGMRFEVCDAKQLDSLKFSPDMVISLHACDTLTDFAIAHAVLSESKIIIAAPCCQHELNGQINNPELALILKHGILKERFAALLTDSIRALIMEINGYKTQVMEFIDSEHTQKNIMLRSVKKKTPVAEDKKIGMQMELQMITERFCVSPTLCRLLVK